MTKVIIERFPTSVAESRQYIEEDVRDAVSLFRIKLMAALATNHPADIAKVIVWYSGTMQLLADRRRMYQLVLTPSMN